MIKYSILQNIFIGLALVFLLESTAFAQTTAFNYQGKLTDSGASQSAYQMQFALFDALAGGSQIGGIIANPSVAINQGVFNVTLDFGASVFTGADRFLQISVRRNVSEAYTVLSPREKIASSPYSIRTLSAGQADLALDATNSAVWMPINMSRPRRSEVRLSKMRRRSKPRILIFPATVLSAAISASGRPRRPQNYRSCKATVMELPKRTAPSRSARLLTRTAVGSVRGRIIRLIFSPTTVSR
jgi:hypothetical protein